MLKHDTGKPFRDVFDKTEVVDVLASLIDIFSKSETTLTTGEKWPPLYHYQVKSFAKSDSLFYPRRRRKSRYTFSLDQDGHAANQVQQPVVGSAEESHDDAHENMDRGRDVSGTSRQKLALAESL